MECFKNHGFEKEGFENGGLEKEGFNCGFTLPFNPLRGWRTRVGRFRGHVNLQFSIGYLLLGIKVREIWPLTRLR